MGRYIKTFLRFLLFLGIGVAILYWLFSSQSADYCANHPHILDCGYPDYWAKLKADFSTVNGLWIGLMILCYMVSNVSRTLRWKILLRSAGHPVQFSNAFVSILITYFANSIIPRSGEVARAAYITRLEKVPVEKALGTIAVGRTLDVLSLLIVLGLGFLLEADMLLQFLRDNNADPAQLLRGKSWLLLLGLVGLLGLGLLIRHRHRFQGHRIYQAVEQKMLGFWKGITAIRYLDRPGWFVFHSIIIWLMYYLMTYVAFFSFPPVAHLQPSAGLMVFIAGTLGILIPAPGGMGAYQYLVGTCLSQMYGIDSGDAFTYSNIAFFPIYFLNLLLGFLAFLYLSLTGKGN